MKNLTISVRPHDAATVVECLLHVMDELGFVANVSKSKVFYAGGVGVATAFANASPQASFVIQGGNVSSDYTEYNAEQEKRLHAFFSKLNDIELHPQVKFTILRLCGSPKLIFYASVTPAQHSASVTSFFATQVRNSLSLLLQGAVAHPSRKKSL